MPNPNLHTRPPQLDERTFHELFGDPHRTAAVVYYLSACQSEATATYTEALRWREAHAGLYEQFVSAVDAAQRAASRALQQAWAPYSGFPVGAALLAVDGSIWDGCNVECSSYGLTLCAERVAVGHAVVRGHRDFVLLVLTTDTDEPILPCGACRQLLHDFSPHLLILSQAARSHRQSLRWLFHLLPEPFSGKHIWKR